MCNVLFHVPQQKLGSKFFFVRSVREIVPPPSKPWRRQTLDVAENLGEVSCTKYPLLKFKCNISLVSVHRSWLLNVNLPLSKLILSHKFSPCSNLNTPVIVMTSNVRRCCSLLQFESQLTVVTLLLLG